MKEIRFISKNPHKIAEIQDLLQPEVKIIQVESSISEIQSKDVRELVKDKTLKAFRYINRPVFVEHTGLFIPELDNFPGGLTQLVWDAIQAEKFCKIAACLADRTISAQTMIGYCDGRKLHYFEGKISGTIAESPKGSKDFQWDCIFIPSGHDRTFGEMTKEEKNKISMRSLAFEAFKNFICGTK